MADDHLDWVVSRDGTRIAFERSRRGRAGGLSPPMFFAAAIEALARALPRNTRRVLAGQQHVAMDPAPELFARELLRFVDASPEARQSSG